MLSINKKLAIGILTLILFGTTDLYSQRKVKNNLGVSYEEVLDQINAIRTRGCKCGSTYMKPTGRLDWNKLLLKSAYKYAKEMSKYDNFSHHSVRGLDVGERVDNIGYKWKDVGENLAKGQITFNETLTDWVESPSHCKMLMNPKMKEMGMARVGKYWVHHFGSLMPPKTKRINTKYTEG